jgi:hypothetical protein
MNRYATVCERIIKRLEIGMPGIGFVIVSPGQQTVVAQALAARLPGVPRLMLSSSLLLQGPRLALVTGVPQQAEARRSLLGELNDRRDWITRHNRCLVLLVDRYELADLQRFAGDVYSAKLFLETVPFEPDTSINTQEARTALAQWQRRRFGNLDLRGFMRSEAEDVSWPIEDIYQDLRAVPWGQALTGPSGQGQETPLQALLASSLGRKQSLRRIVILGHPGSGKTFFLRWLALTAATQESMWGIESPFPFLLSLSTFAQMPSPASLLDCFLEGLLIEDQPAAHLLSSAVEKKRAIFLLDGLDEVGDEASRRRIVEALHTFSRQVEGCPILITSRISGYDAAAIEAWHYLLVPFNDENIRNFLVRWCELYSRDRLGSDPDVQRRGRSEGLQLGQDVIGNPGVRELARNPLLLTVLAIVHRSGVRLPDHRVELYDHATKVLVERWNRVRSLARFEPVPPLKSADAVRLLGPVALETVRQGTRGAITESMLRDRLARALKEGNLRGVATADEAISLFRNSLGLLVEQGPGLFAFLHLTLAEYFAAWELVRSGELERIAADSVVAFYPEWREILLLAAGVLGINRADDVRLAELVNQLLDSAARRSGKPSGTVPSLLGGLLVDDPGLSASIGSKIIQTLIPTWWFERRYGKNETLSLVAAEAVGMANRLVRSRFAGDLCARVKGNYESPPSSDVIENLCRAPYPLSPLMNFVEFLKVLKVDTGPTILHIVENYSETFLAGEFLLLPYSQQIWMHDGTAYIRFSTSRWLDEQIRSHSHTFNLRVQWYYYLQKNSGRWVKGDSQTISWEQTQRVITSSQFEVSLEAQFSLRVEDTPARLAANIYLQKSQIS